MVTNFPVEHDEIIAANDVNSAYYQGAFASALNHGSVNVSDNAVPTVESTTLTTANNVSNFIINMPATRPDGDLYICVAMRGSNTDWYTPPSNWTSIHTISNVMRYHAWYWIGDSEPATYTIGQSMQMAAAVIYRISDFDASNPINIDGTTSGTSTNGYAPAVTTTVNNCLVIRAISVDVDDVTATQPTEDHKGCVSSEVGYGCSHETQATAGDTGTSQFTHASDQWGTGTIAINPTGLILAANSSRKTMLLKNNSAVTVYLGPSGVTISTGYALSAGDSIYLYNKEAVYGITSAAGSNDIRYLEAQ